LVKLTIGLPTYNCENTIGNKIEELLKQSFKDYVLIISDNNSTDNTGKICESMSKKDNRIVFFQQDKNKGPFWNFNFLLQKAQTNYFVMTTPDDILSKNFLESNINILEKCKELVGSIGECSLFNRIIDSNSHKFEINILKNSRKYQYVHPVKGELKEKIRFYLDFQMGSQFYSIFRTKDIKFANFYRNKANYGMWQSDFAAILKILKRGNLHVDLESFLYKEVSTKSHSVIKYMKIFNFSISEILFSKAIFSVWFFKEFGTKLFLKNFGVLLGSNFSWGRTIFGEVLRMCKRMIYGQEKYW
jgi:glycosyltransferase involved in cell wall biosynthesis